MTRTLELAEEHIKDLEARIEHAKSAILRMYEKTLEGSHLDKDSDFYTEDSEEMPFFSESYLYCLLDKEDARTVLAMLHRVEEAFDMVDGDPYPGTWRQVQEREQGILQFRGRD